MSTVGFPGDENFTNEHYYMYEGVGKIINIESDNNFGILYHTGDTRSGNSGGPIFNKNNDLIAINGGGDSYGNVGCIFKGTINTLIYHAIHDNNTVGEFNKVLYTYRLYNSYNKEHFFTIDPSERDRLINNGWKYEGIGFKVVNSYN